MNKRVLLLSMLLLGGASASAYAAPVDVAVSANPAAAIEAEVAGLTGAARVTALNQLVLAIAALPGVTAGQKNAAIAATLDAIDAAGGAPSPAAASAAAGVAADAGATAAVGDFGGDAAGTDSGGGEGEGVDPLPSEIPGSPNN